MLFRAIVGFSFYYIESPRSVNSYLLCTLLTISSILQFLTVEAIFMRKMKNLVRGTLSGIAFFFGALGTTSYVQLGGIVFDEIAPWAPFTLAATADTFLFLFSILFVAFGLLKKDD